MCVSEEYVICVYEEFTTSVPVPATAGPAESDSASAVDAAMAVTDIRLTIYLTNLEYMQT